MAKREEREGNMGELGEENIWETKRRRRKKPVDAVIVLAERHCCGEGRDLAGRYQCLYELAERQFHPLLVGDCERRRVGGA